MNFIRWGVLSTAKIGVEQVIPAMQKGELSKISAISSREEDRAKEVADRLGIEKAYGSYEELLEDEDIDAIYNPLPNHLHVPMTIKALEAGKHVLCEKPIAIDLAEAEELVKIMGRYPELKVMEAFMYRFHPQWQVIKQWIDDGEIGAIQTIHSSFTYYNDDPENIRNKADMGGGGLLDIGCYCISASRYLFEDEPINIKGEVEIHPDFGVDTLASGVLRFAKGTATFSCSTLASPDQKLIIYGTSGIIEMDIPFNPQESQASIRITSGEGQVLKEKTLQANHYTIQGDAFSKAIIENRDVPTPLNDAVANMRVIDALLSL
ncbi:Gfo/Idh/MocA family protein [Gracilimonas sediminicola]|uniref:Gfo/Idh/MocA family protein n=1 Tax=Gracilimonas sediminicola TaxID=2952158 RepID=UPI0038D3B717